MIMRSGIWGGIVAFIRFVLLEGVANSVLLICPEKVRKICSLFIVLDQSASITQGNISVERALAVPVSFAVEILILTIIYLYMNKKRDFA